MFAGDAAWVGGVFYRGAVKPAMSVAPDLPAGQGGLMTERLV
jgi:hypothetical protein